VNADTPDFIELDSIERMQGADIVSHAPNTSLVTIRGRDPRGEPMLVTLRCEDFERIVEGVQNPWQLSNEESEALAAQLILQEMAGRDG
jgi:hypothetical protein